MWEDVAGTQSAGTGRTYATCAECGEVFLRQTVRPVEAGLVDDVKSEFTELCPRCEAMYQQGEEPIPLDIDPSY